MYIRTIRLQGFKSFPDRTELEFGPGISAIVGPNGCGKSNILDAVQWCFGTQSPRQLRGATMQDVIFAGAAGRAPAGFAEVTVTFTNEDGRAPEPWREVPEIRISRRLDRSGEGVYRINGARVRLRDVQEFLMDIGYGEYSVIQQGAIGRLVQARPEEVRLFLEQAGRMTKFRARRDEAQQKLIRAEENLERVLDLIEEIERQLRSLERQAAKARRAAELDERRYELASVLHHLFVARTTAERQGLERDLEELRTRTTGVHTAIAGREATQEELHREVLDLERVFEETLHRQQRLQERRSALTTRRAADRRELERLEEELERAGAELERITKERTQLAEEVAVLAERETAARSVLDELETRRRALQEEVTHLQEEVARRLTERDRLRDELVAGLEELTNARSRSLEAARIVEHARRRLAELAERRAETERRRDGTATTIAELEARLAGLGERLAATRTQRDELVARRRALDEAVAAARERRDRLQAERDRLAIQLAQLVAALERTGTDEVEPPPGARLPWRLVAPRAEVVDLAETVLGSHLGCWVVERLDGAVWERLTANAEERRVVRVLPTTPSEPPPPGYRPASELLEVPPAERTWIERLLAGIWLSDEPLTPGRLLPASGWCEIWDVAGRCVRADGTWEAGPLRTGGSAHLAAERVRLERELDSATKMLEAAEEQLVALERESANLEDRLAELTNVLEETQRTGRELQHELELEEQRLADLGDELALLEQDRERIEAEVARYEEEGSRSEDRVTELEARTETLRARVEVLGTELAPLEAQREELESRTTAVEEELTAAREGWQEARRAVEAARLRLDGLAEREEHLRRLLEDGGTRRRQLGERLAELGCELEGVDDQAAAVAAELEGLARRREELEDRRHRVEQELRELNQQYEALRRNEAELEARVRELTRAIDEERERFVLRFGREPATVAPAPGADPEVLATKLAELDRKRERLGPVNPEAVAEYEATKARHDELQAQRADLLASIERLRTSIQRMNRESRERFRVTFEAVNRRFGEIFAKLFRGGTAQLRLVDPDDWLESGVEIVAQPPGTRLTRLDLLSGGQRAMTALALVFAIFLTHPSPFCILDEVDAPLDDANIARFNQVLVELNEIAQILLITHNKHTMEIADALHGVTMEEQGISKVIPVRMA